MGAFECDLFRFARLIRGELRPEPKQLLTEPTVADLVRLSKEKPYVAVDIETGPETPEEPWTALDPGRAKLRTLGFGNSEWGLSFRWDTAGEAIKQESKRILADHSIVKVWCNGFWYDHRILYRYGFVITNNVDIRDMRRAMSSTSKVSLRHMASLFCDAENWKDAEDSK